MPIVEDSRIAVAIQGGAMRSIYCVGAVRAIQDSGLVQRIASVHSASAGVVAGMLLSGLVTGQSESAVEVTSRRVLDRLAGDSFINLRRPSCTVDVDYLVDVLVEEIVEHWENRKLGLANHEVAVTDRAGRAEYFALQEATQSFDMGRMRDCLRATMAIPVLYPRRATVEGRQFFDGGIVDPLPVRRAASSGANLVISISNVRPHELVESPASGVEAILLKIIPVATRGVRRAMLVVPENASYADKAIRLRRAGTVPVLSIAPSNPEAIGSRLERDPIRLRQLEQLGYDDATAQIRSFLS